MVRKNSFYALGKSEEELLAYDELDSNGSGDWFTNNLMMVWRYRYKDAIFESSEKLHLHLKVYLVEVEYDVDSDTVISTHISQM